MKEASYVREYNQHKRNYVENKGCKGKYIAINEEVVNHNKVFLYTHYVA